MKRPIRTNINIENLFKRGIPKHFHSTVIDDFQDYGHTELAEVREMVREYLSNIDEMFEKNRGIFFYGNNGVGKSMLASLIVKEAYKHRYTSKRTTFLDYINAYTRVWDAGNLTDREELESILYNEYKAVEFLVIEEIGKELETKLAPTVLEDCLRYREERGLVTILCSNLTPKDLVSRYGKSIGSLLKGNMTPVCIVGEDRREESYEGQ